ncbi:hypothetical protein MWU52_12680 [Jannaschia sp. S6380]|uniref:hypothetical protein n=1 Tax=Jannaschia sp. S6380 TaxID=2926408 RepID=UPI001FF24E42|nr:hypothetical protein [Jannaschia sp. S6380]MCK0168412.1 hypothetical protein [Jannaschia sp. S6380]
MTTQPGDRADVKPAHSVQAAIDAHGDAPVILVWVASKPRIATMRPIARSLREAGFATVVAYSPSLGPSAAKDLRGTDCLQIPPERLCDLRGVSVFLSAEQNAALGPLDAIRFAIHHSLPDYDLRRDYGHLLAGKPLAVAAADYYAIPVRQAPDDWTVANYGPHVDRLLPPALLEGRPDRFVVVPFGYPKVDHMMQEETADRPLDTITYAPTQTVMSFSSVERKGARILKMLLRNFPDHRIAFRPYPGPDLKRLAGLIDQFRDNPRFVLDDSPTGEDLMRRTALVVTDRSSIAMSFGLGYARPVAFFRAAGLVGKRDAEIEEVAPIGLRAGSVNALRKAVRRLLANPQAIADRIRRERGDHICNPGRSTDYLVEIMPDIIAGRTRPEWLTVPRRPFPGRSHGKRAAQFDAMMTKLSGHHSRIPVIIEETLRQGFLSDTPSPRANPVRLSWARLTRRMSDLRRYLSRPRGRPKE